MSCIQLNNCPIRKIVLCQVYNFAKDDFRPISDFGKSSNRKLELWQMEHSCLSFPLQKLKQSSKYFLKKCLIYKGFGKLIL